MTLKEWIKNVDLDTNVRIWGQNGKDPLFEGSAFKIPWTLIDFPIGPISVDTCRDSNNVMYPRIIIDVIDNIEKEEKVQF